MHAGTVLGPGYPGGIGGTDRHCRGHGRRRSGHSAPYQSDDFLACLARGRGDAFGSNGRDPPSLPVPDINARGRRQNRRDLHRFRSQARPSPESRCWPPTPGWHRPRASGVSRSSPNASVIEDNKCLKRALFLSSFDSIRLGLTSWAYFDRKRAQGKRHNQALIALAHRRLKVLFAMIHDGSRYDVPEPISA